MLSIIAAIAKNNVIGKNNNLIWHLPEDLKRFKNLTTGHTIIMGRKTFESLGRVLPNRKHVIITNNKNMKIENENVEIIQNINMIEKYKNSSDEVFIIGGATIYKLLMPLANKMYITYIDEEFEGDVFFPQINEKEWKIVNEEKGLTNKENPYNYKYVNYERVQFENNYK